MNDLAREAQWLVTPEAELQRARKAGTVLSRRYFREAAWQSALALIGMGGMGWAVYGFATSQYSGREFLLVLGGGFWCLCSAPFVRRWERQQDSARDAERVLEDEFGRNQGYFVSVIVRQGDAPTGQDSGMLWFEDGRLYFSGHRTSFGLFPSQVFGPALARKGVPGVRNAVEISLRHSTPIGPMALSFGMWERPHENASVERSILKAHLDRWLNEGTSGEGQWPPAELGPKRVSEGSLLAGAIAWTLLPTALVGGILRSLVPDWASLGCALALAVLVAAVPPCNLRWRALRDRRRLGEVR